ncbi:MAG: hypothetical protein OXQ89_14845 [Rhodospirillaceae bacterium]|nr:hypothetical protein [Rhodospirillaceae bacterium]
MNIVTLKWGDRYGPHFANRLYGGVSRHLTRGFRFLCLTDDQTGLRPEIDTYPLPSIELPDKFARSAWLKLGLFQDRIGDMEGECLFLDLDLLITKDIDCFFDYTRGKKCIIHNWVQRHQVFKKRPDVGNSSVFRWIANTTQHIVDKFHSERDWALREFRPPQTYLTYSLGEKCWWPDDWVRSFKRHATPPFPCNLMFQPKLPAGTRILVFHGRPDPDEALTGYRDVRLHRCTRPAPWIATHWYDGSDVEARGPI